MFYIVEIDGKVRNIIDIHGKANKYGACKYFETFQDAQKWVDKHSYKGMSMKYEIKGSVGR